MNDVVSGLCLVALPQLLGASDDALAHTIGVLVEEQKRRALEQGDLSEIADGAFESWGFNRLGASQLPRLHEGLLVCPGYKFEKSATSHDCSFVSVDGVWVWEHPETVLDEMRSAAGPKTVRQTVSILPAFEGMSFDVVRSSARSGPCRMKDSSSFTVRSGKLVETARRVRTPQEHR